MFIFSSTGIYGHNSEINFFSEFDAVKPPTHHHNSKWLGECAVNQFSKDPLILRAGWLFGGLPKNKKNFVANRIREALNSKKNISIQTFPK